MFGCEMMAKAGTRTVPKREVLGGVKGIQYPPPRFGFKTRPLEWTTPTMSQSPASLQDAIYAVLADPATHGGAAVERIDTHISTVFLAGDQVVKVKKAVTLPFLDFAPLAAREAACRKEVVLNQRTAPDLYLGVEPITQDADGTLALNGSGEVVDWAIRMRRFDQSGLLNAVAARGELTRSLMLDLAEGIAAFHAQAEQRSDFGGAAALRGTVDGNEASFSQFYGSVFDGERVSTLLETSRQHIARHAALLDRRQAQGLVRQCHGDMHLGNICLIDGKPMLFDGIEFNDHFAIIDVFYDLAFLLMDLDANGYRAQASILLNAYLDLTGDYDGLAVLPVMLSMRAQIRSHVSAAIAQHVPDPAPLRKAALDYLALAERYLAAAPVSLVAVGGLSGSGKSRCARGLAPRFASGVGAVVLRSDVLRKQIAGVSPTDRLPAEAYGPGTSEAVYARLCDHAKALLAVGQPVIADAVFARPHERAAIEAAAQEAGVAFAGLWLASDPAIAAERISSRTRNASDATPEVLQAQLGYDLGEMTWTQLDSSGPKSDTDAAAWDIVAPVVTAP